MNNKQRKRLILFVLPYMIIMAGIIASLILCFWYFPMSEKYMITAYLPVFIWAMAMYLAMALAVLAAQMWYLLYLGSEL